MTNKLTIEIDSGSGFCFGVTTAIRKAEEELRAGTGPEQRSTRPELRAGTEPEQRAGTGPEQRAGTGPAQRAGTGPAPTSSSQTLYCLGDIVHNSVECERLRQMGLITINHEEMARLHDVKVLLRAHGEPPETYELARRNNIEIIDATCPVVLKLQKRIRENYEFPAAPSLPLAPVAPVVPSAPSAPSAPAAPVAPSAPSSPSHPQIVIFGKKGHAEVLGLVGQTQGTAIVIESFDEVKKLDFSHDIFLYSQTTKSLDEFHRIIGYIQDHIAPGATFRSFDTICRSVANRMTGISQFAARHDLILFVCGRKSSNGKVLFDECRRVNPNSHLIEGPEEIDRQWLEGIETVGICGATSTPKWLMEQCRDFLS